LIDTAENDPKRSDVNTPFEFTDGMRIGKQADKKDVLYNMRHFSRWSLPTSIRVGFASFSIALALDAAASIKEEGPTPDLVGKTRLTSTEITRLFSDVIDRGEVQNDRGISAETHWHADGTFVSRWWTEANPANDANDKGSVTQEVRGRWRAEHDLRCVTFDSVAQPDWSCAEVWLLDDGRVLSLNPDGSAHGLHRLSPLK
jgi:hypothetical protein